MKFLLIKAVCFLFLGNLFLTLSLAGAWTFYFWQVLFSLSQNPATFPATTLLSNSSHSQEIKVFRVSIILFSAAAVWCAQFDRSCCNDIIVSSLSLGELTPFLSFLHYGLWAMKLIFFHAGIPNIRRYLTPKGLQEGGCILYPIALISHFKLQNRHSKLNQLMLHHTCFICTRLVLQEQKPFLICPHCSS